MIKDASGTINGCRRKIQPVRQAWGLAYEIFDCGPLERYAAGLRALSFTLGSVEVPVPHAHQHRREYDAQAAAILQAFPWTRTPLKPEYEQ